MEDLNRKLDRLNNQSSITTGFKLQCLNTSLKFIKDDNQLMMEYPDLTAPQAELLHTLICNPNVNSDIGFGFKSFYAPLWEAMKIFGLKYEFKIREVPSNGSNMQCLILEKIPKMAKIESNNNNNIKPTPMDTSESEISLKSDTSLSSKKKKQRNSDVALKKLPNTFLKNSLDKITEFYNDDATASVTFNNLNDNERYFFGNFKNIIASNRMRSVFDKCIRMAFENLIVLAASKDNYKLCVKSVKMCDDRDKAISFSKIPVFEKQSVSRANVVDKKENTASNRSSDRSVSQERGNIKISVNGQPNSVKDAAEASASRINNESVDRSPTVYKTTPLPSFTRYSLFHNSAEKNCEILRKGTGASKNAQSNVKDNIEAYAETYLVDNPKQHKARDRTKPNQTAPLKTNVAVTKSKSKGREAAVRSDKSTDRTDSKDRRVNGISFQPGGVLDPKHSDVTMDTVKAIEKVKVIDKVKAIEKADNRQKERPRSGADLNNRKIKLLEAMSVPMRSDIALKMMRGMGWEGGALGLRGDGITEPLIPALDRVAWAGLGHTPPPKQQQQTMKPRKPAEFRSELLAAILQLISSNNALKVLSYRPVLAKKEQSFLRQIIQCYRTKSRIELVDDEMILSNQIVHVMKSNPNLILQGSVSPCKSQIHLSKVVTNPVQHVNTRDLAIFHRMAKIEDKLKRVLRGDISDMVAGLEQDCHTKKLYEMLEFKIEILIYLLEFFKAKEIKMTWCSKNSLNKKKINYIDYAMESINLRARFGSTEPEIALVKEMLRLAGDYQLEYTFFNQFSSFTVTKICKPRNDLKTQKNVAINNNESGNKNRNKISKNEADVVKNTDKITLAKSVTDNTEATEINSQSETIEDTVSSSDDVVIIEGKDSPIMISDDENDLLQSPKAATADYESKKTVPDLELSAKCDNLDFEHDLRELEKAIIDADKEESSPFGKRARGESPNSDVKMSKITKLEAKKVYIVHSDYPNDRLNKVNIQNLQELISCNILKSDCLPLLKCHGVQDGVLVYSCHSEQSYDWLKNIINVASDVTILDTKEVIEDSYKMSLQFNCYFDFDVDYVFEMLELYNEDFNTSKWVVLKHNVCMDHVSIVVKMDLSSYYYVRNSGYSLFAGVDEVQFSIILD